MTAHTTDGGPAFPVHDLQAAQPSSMNDLNAMARGMSLREADAEIDRLRAREASLEESLHYANGVADLAMKHRDDAENRVAELEPDANAFRAMVNLQMYIGFRQGTVVAFSDGILAASVFNLGHDALSAARNAIADHATALNECSKKADDALAKAATP